MKKLLVFLWALLAVSASVSAQGLTATLQQGDKMTPFYGPDAFVQAYNAAQKGAVITLAAGEFNTVDSIMKEVTIIGNGYRENKTVIKPKEFDSYERREYKLPISMIIRANNVKLEGLDMNCVMIDKTNHLTIRHCKIHNLNGPTSNFSPNKSQHKNTVVDQCLIGVDFATSGENYCVKNSIVTAFLFVNEKEPTNTLISNCLLGFKGGSEETFPNAVYKNCLICQSNNDGNITNVNLQKDGREFYNNVFFTGLIWSNDKGAVDGTYNIFHTLNPDMKWTTPELDWEDSQTCKGNTTASYSSIFGDSDDENPLLAPIITTITGDDGKVVGPYGGTGFSWNPGIPRIVDSQIDSYTDSEGKLNAKIKVELNN